MLAYLLSCLPNALRSCGTPQHSAPDSKAAAPGERTRFADLPPELQRLIARTAMEQNIATPSADPVAPLASLDPRLASVFQEPLAATQLIRPLWTAQGSQPLVEALDGLEKAPLSQRRWCHDSVIPALLHSIGGENATTAESLLRALLDHLPVDAAARLRLLQQTADALLRLPPMFPGVVEQLFGVCVVEPRLPPAMWRQLLRLLVVVPRYQRDGVAMRAAAEALSPARRTEFELLMDILDAVPPTPGAPTVEALLERIGALTPGPVATTLYGELLRGQERFGHADGIPAICTALLAAADQPDGRENALAMLPADLAPSPELHATLSRHLDRLRPEAAMALLTRQWRTFAIHWHRLPPQCAEVLRRARTTPAEHAATALVAARRMHGLDGLAQRTDLAWALLAELPHLPLAARLPVLAAFEHHGAPTAIWQADWSCLWQEVLETSHWRADWIRAWQETLEATCRAVAEGNQAMPAREGIRALAAALPHEERLGHVLQPRAAWPAVASEAQAGPLIGALDRLLRPLDHHALADAIRDIVQVYAGRSDPAEPTGTTLQLLLRHGARLPYELRAALLRQIATVTANASAVDRRMLDAFRRRIRRDEARWRSQADEGVAVSA